MRNNVMLILIVSALFLCTSLHGQTKFIGKKVASEVIEDRIEKNVSKKVAKEVAKSMAEKTVKSQIKNIAKQGFKQIDDPLVRQISKKVARRQLHQIAKNSGQNTIEKYAIKTAKNKIQKSLPKHLKVSIKKGKYIKRALGLQKGFSKSGKKAIIGKGKNLSYRMQVYAKNQYISSKAYKRFLKSPKVNSLELGKEKSGEILRKNMRISMGEKKFANFINTGNSEAHHVIGNSPRAKPSKMILEKYGIDINDPINGIMLPTSEASILKGSEHLGSHTYEYIDYVNQKMVSAKSKDDCYLILDQIKKELYSGKLGVHANSTQIINL